MPPSSKVAKVHLKFKGLHSKTVRAYKRAISLFFKYLRREGHAIPTNSRTFDLLLGEFVNELFQQGESPGNAGSATWPSLIPAQNQEQTACGFTVLFQLDYSVPPQRVPPMPWLVAKAMAGVAMYLSRPRVGLCYVIQFLFCLRTGELFEVQAEHIQIIDRQQIILALPFTKTGRG